MPKIELITRINAPIQRVFDLSRSIDLHKISTQHTHEEAIAGVTKGLIGMNEQVTWKAKHFGRYHTLTSTITAFEPPFMFTDEMVSGAFKSFRHVHSFEEKNGVTIMTDLFDYTSPLGFLGKCADFIFLKRYMTQLLETRNQIIRQFAETNRWKEVLS